MRDISLLSVYEFRNSDFRFGIIVLIVISEPSLHNYV